MNAKTLSDAILFTVAIAAGSTALALYIGEVSQNINNTVYPDSSDATNFPNSFEMQYILPDWNRRGVNNEQILYNVAIDMHSKSFSAHVPIKVHAALSFVKSSVPSYYAIPETMYVYFPGSHSIPRQTTGLGSGSVFGYIVAKKTVDNNFIIRYEGVNITQYEMSGQFPVYVTYTAPSIEKYDPVLYTSSPIINIATEEATNAFNQQEESKHNQLHQDMATLAIVAVSFIAAIPPANEFIDRYSARRAKSVKGNDTDNGYNGKSTNDH